MVAPLIGLWWWTKEEDLICLRCPTFSGIQQNITRTIMAGHDSAWHYALPSTSPYYRADPCKFIKGWVNFNTVLGRYEIISEDDSLFKNDHFKEAIIKDFHLDGWPTAWLEYNEFQKVFRVNPS